MFFYFMLIEIPLILAPLPLTSPPFFLPTPIPSLTDECTNLDCHDLFYSCKYFDMCSDYCENKDDASSLTIIDCGCGYVYQLSTESGKIRSIYSIPYISQSYQLLYADINIIIWIENNNVINFIRYNSSYIINFDNWKVLKIKIFVDYDQCQQLLYVIDDTNMMYRIPENEIVMSIPGPLDIAAAAIDFEKQMLFIARRQNGIRIEIASLTNGFFSFLENLDFDSLKIIMKVNPTVNELYVTSDDMHAIIYYDKLYTTKIFKNIAVTSFDFDDNNFYCTSKNYKDILKGDRSTLQFSNFPTPVNSFNILIAKTKKVTDIICTTQFPISRTVTQVTQMITNITEVTLTITNITEVDQCNNKIECSISDQITKIDDSAISLIITDIKCGTTYYVNKISGKLKTIFCSEFFSKSYNGFYANKNKIIGLNNGTFVVFNTSEWELIQLNIDPSSKFIDFDNCNDLVYLVSKYKLVTFPPTQSRSLYNLQYTLISASIDFQNRLLYIVLKSKTLIATIHKTDLNKILLTHVYSFDINETPSMIKVNPTENQLYVTINNTLLIIDIANKQVLVTLDTKCNTTSFDFDGNYFYFRCANIRNIRKIDRITNIITNLTQDIFSDNFYIYQTLTVTEPNCQPSTAGIILPSWGIPVIAGGVGGFFLLIVIIVCLCCKSKKSIRHPPLPPDFTGLRISDKMQDDNIYTDLDVYNNPLQKNKIKTIAAPTLPALRSKSIYADIISLNQYPAPDYENLS